MSVTIRAALYARVSSQQQAKQDTIASQVAALRERVAADELLLLPEHCFVDEGHSGSTLVRPALERLRDLAYAGGCDRLYVHSPDRLARHYAYQILLLEELQGHGIEVVFLNQSLGQTPEERMLVQMQGMIAEYERAKIMERSRRGKRHAAQQGRVSVLAHAPYGYRYHTKRVHGEARFEVEVEQAQVVRQIFQWVGCERLALGEVSRRLHRRGVLSPTGQLRWSSTTLAFLLRNSAYRGQAAYRGSSGLTPSVPPRIDNRMTSTTFAPSAATSSAATEVISIPVPALVSDGLFAAAQEQLQENRRRARQQRRREPHLLQGLLVCQMCGRAYVHSKCASTRCARVYRYYRCTSMLAEGRCQRRCVNRSIPASALEEAVWQDVSALLREPQRLAAEFARRRSDRPQATEGLLWLEQQQAKEERVLKRLLDAYESGLLEQEELKPRLQRTRQRLLDTQTQLEQLRAARADHERIKDALDRLEDFTTRIEDGLREPTPQQQREILKALVKRVEIAPNKIRVIYKIHPLPPGSEIHNGQFATSSKACVRVSVDEYV